MRSPRAIGVLSLPLFSISPSPMSPLPFSRRDRRDTREIDRREGREEIERGGSDRFNPRQSKIPASDPQNPHHEGEGGTPALPSAGSPDSGPRVTNPGPRRIPEQKLGAGAAWGPM